MLKTTRVGVYCCDNSCATDFGPVLMALDQYAIRNEWREKLEIEEYAECWPMAHMRADGEESPRPILGILADDVVNGKIDVVVVEDLDVLEESLTTLSRLRQACAERQVPIRVLGPQPHLEKEE